MDLHGGNIYRLQREGKDNLLDYSSNINPLGVPEKFKERVINSFHILEKYPDPEYVELRENIAKYIGKYSCGKWSNRDSIFTYESYET